ncbi:DUF6207 family protein [Streptomyces niveus]|uniref:DUF6207 family protein n=1 Tax=Streptomyces niveus TaxID=193462 RepID=UPI00340B40FA
MDRIDVTQIPEPGLVVLDLTAHDEATAHAVMAALDRLWATSGITPARREPGVPGVRAPHPRGHPAHQHAAHAHRSCAPPGEPGAASSFVVPRRWAEILKKRHCVRLGVSSRCPPGR